MQDFSQEVLEYVNVEEGLGRLRGNQAIFKKLLQRFLDSEDYKQLTNEFKSGNLERAAATAHTVKGMTGNLSLTKLYNASIAFEAKIKEGSATKDDILAYGEVWNKTRLSVKMVMESLA